MTREESMSGSVLQSASAEPNRVDPRVESAGALLWLRPLLLALLATALFLGWVYFVRSGQVAEPLRWPQTRGFEFDPYVFGLGAQEYALPLVLLLVLSRTALFRRIVTGAASQRDLGLLAVALVALQIIYAVAQYGLIKALDDQATVGFLVVFAAGWLGGWQVGLAVGAVAMFTLGLNNYAIWGWQEVFDFHEFFEYWMLKSAEPNSAAWLGCTAGFISAAVPFRHRFKPSLLVLVGLVAELVASAAIVFTLDDPSWYLLRLPSVLIISGLSFLAFALIVRNVQAEDGRLQAESARLELAQANLLLTRTKLALTQAELRALHAQINPHFFFNSLNTIRYFVRTDPSVARDLLTQLSELFQRALSAGEFVPLQAEIQHVEAYLALEKARLDERLTVIWTNLAKDLLDQSIPTLTLQPLVENAVLHGISPKAEGGTIHIVINRVGNDLLLQVDDDGVGFHVSTLQNHSGDSATAVDQLRPHNAIGLRNVDERLRMLYGASYGLHIESTPEQGTRAIMRIPLENSHR